MVHSLSKSVTAVRLLRFESRGRYALHDASGGTLEARAMICAACGAPLATSAVFPGGSVRCDCGATSKVSGAPDHAAQGGAYRVAAAHDVACPRCGGALIDDVAGHELACAACGGVFVDHDALAARVDAARAEGQTSPAETAAVLHRARAASFEVEVRYLPCACCAKTMNRMNFGKHSGIVVDVCKVHGTWFDAGELEGVLAFVRGGGLERELETEAAESSRTRAKELTPEAARALCEAESLMRYEALREEQATRHGVDLLDDLLSLLFGPRYGGR